MSMESDLVTVLKTVCPRVFPDVAPASTARPYLTYQGIGGVSLRFLDNQPASKRNTLVQVSVWAATRAEAKTIIRAAEDAICAAAAFQAEPQGEPVDLHDEDTSLYGDAQRFSIWANR